MATQDEQIVWPPLVIICNTAIGPGADGKMMGLGNAELEELFKEYLPVNGKNAYDYNGHAGIGFLTFHDDDRGYYLASFLDKALRDEHCGRKDWLRLHSSEHYHRVNDEGKPVLYGYLATVKDMLDPKMVKLAKAVKWKKVSKQLKVNEPEQRKLELNQEILRLRREKEELDMELAKKKKELDAKLSKEVEKHEKDVAENEQAHNALVEAAKKEFINKIKFVEAQQYELKRHEEKARAHLTTCLTQQQNKLFQQQAALAEKRKDCKSRVDQLEEKLLKLDAKNKAREREYADRELQREKEKQAKFKQFVKELKQERDMQKEKELRKVSEQREEKLRKLDDEIRSQQNHLNELEQEAVAAEMERERLQEEENEAARLFGSQPQDDREDCALCTTPFAADDRRKAYTCQAHVPVVCMACAREEFRRSEQQDHKSECPGCGAAEWASHMPSLKPKRGRTKKKSVNPTVKPCTRCMMCKEVFALEDHRRGLPPCGHSTACVACLEEENKCRICKHRFDVVLPCPSKVYFGVG